MDYLLGIDAGTSSVKAALCHPERGIVAEARVDCPADFGKNGFAEIDMNRYWEALRECLAMLSRDHAPSGLSEVKALAVSSQGVTFVPLDRDGREMRPGIVMYDGRATVEAVDIGERFGAETIFRVTGQPVSPETFEAPKLLWLKRHEPEMFEKIGKILLVHDYLVYRLTGVYCCVPSLMSSSLLFDVRAKTWWVDMLSFIGLSPDRLPPMYDAGEPVGTVTKKVSAMTGLPGDAIVAAGAIDQVCGMVGVGNTRPGILSESTGSVLAVHAVSERFFDNRSAGIHHFRNVLDGTFALIGVCPTAGSAFTWFGDVLCSAETEEAGSAGRSVFDLLTEQAGTVPAGSEGLVLLPYLSGRGSPRPDPRAQGGWFGMKLRHTKGHFVRSLLESIAFMLRDNCEMFRQNGFDIGEIRSFGGGTRSALWNSIKADVCNIPIRTSAAREPGCVGAAILAGVGAGMFESIGEGCGCLVRDGEVFAPDGERAQKYEEYYHYFQRLTETMGNFTG